MLIRVLLYVPVLVVPVGAVYARIIAIVLMVRKLFQPAVAGTDCLGRIGEWIAGGQTPRA